MKCCQDNGNSTRKDWKSKKRLDVKGHIADNEDPNVHKKYHS